MKKKVSDAVKPVVVLGGLTDIFSLNLALQFDSASECFMTTHVTDSRDYVLYMLLLCLPEYSECIKTLSEKSTKDMICVPDEDESFEGSLDDAKSAYPTRKKAKSASTFKETGKGSSQEKKITRGEGKNICFDDSDELYQEKLNYMQSILMRRDRPFQTLTSSALNARETVRHIASK